jgi:hypothetical protein
MSNYALSFNNNVPNWLILKNGPILSGLTNWYINFTVRTTQSSPLDGAAIYCERAPSGSDIVKVELGESGANANKLGLVYRDDAGTLNRLYSTNNVNDGTVHVVSVLKVGTAISITMDGVVSSGTLTATNNFTNSGIVTSIARDYGDSTAYFGGTVYAVNIGTSAISLSDSWYFPEGQGNTTVDSVGSNNGVLSGAPLPQWVPLYLSYGRVG